MNRCNVICTNEHGLLVRLTLTERATFDLLYQLTGNGAPRDYKGRHNNADYILKVIR